MRLQNCPEWVKEARLYDSAVGGFYLREREREREEPKCLDYNSEEPLTERKSSLWAGKFSFKGEVWQPCPVIGRN